MKDYLLEHKKVILAGVVIGLAGVYAVSRLFTLAPADDAAATE